MTTTAKPRDTRADRDTDGEWYPMGCSVNPVRLGCLTCPLSQCKYDDGGKWLAEEKRKQFRQLVAIAKRRNPGVTADRLAERFNVSPRTIHRVMAAIRSA